MTLRRRQVPPRSAAAAKQARYRSRVRGGVAFVPVPVTGAIVDCLVHAGLLPADREAVSRSEIGAAIGAALDRLARSER